METTTDVMRIQAKDLTACSTEIFVTDNGKEISVYGDERADANDVAQAYNKLMYAYPNLSRLTDKQEVGFIKVFAEAVEYSKMSKAQLIDSVMNCICNKHQYGELQIADVLSYDKRLPLHTYNETSGVGMSALQVGTEIYFVRPEEAAKIGYKVINKKLVRI